MPALKISILTLSVLAIATVTENLAIGYDGDVASAAGAMKGINTFDVVSGEQASVDVLGTSIATAGAAIADGAELEVGANGKLVTKTAGVVVARALQPASADGDLLEVFLLPK